MLLSIALLVTEITLNVYKNQKDKDKEVTSNQKTQKTSTVDDQNDKNPWSFYSNTDYSISFSYPYLLHKVEYEDSGEYKFFIVFEENQFSVEKGVAFGVSKDGLEKEVAGIKEEISKQGKSKIIKDEQSDFGGNKSWILEFEKEEESLENRSFLIIQKGDYTYSFSTVPGQMQKLSESIQFLD